MSRFTLPDNANKDARNADLARYQSLYNYNYDYGIPISTKVQKEDKAQLPWTLAVVKAMITCRSNVEQMYEATGWKTNVPLPIKSVPEITKYFAKSDLQSLFAYYLPDCGYFPPPKGRPTSIEDYKAVFQVITKPEFLKTAEKSAGKDETSDEFFAYSFVAGPNPNMLKKMQKIPEKLPLTQAHFAKTDAFKNDNLQEALANGRVFYVDYESLNTLNSGVHPDGSNKYIYQPIVVMGLPKGETLLRPIAVQCGQDPKRYPIFTPYTKTGGENEYWGWKMAKTVAWVAHYCYHEMITHLAFTHLLIEPVVVATHRQLHVTHPIAMLLQPHFEGTLPINNLAVTNLIQPGQAVDRLVGSTKDSNYAFIAKERLAYSFSDNYLPRRMQLQGVATAEDIPIYPYRDDGDLIWNAIKNWVGNYVSLAYGNDKLVADDIELKAWAKEINSPNGGKVKDFGVNGVISTRDQLIDACTMIIFTAGPQHGAVNFAQLTDMLYVPAAPLAGYRLPPSLTGMTERTYLDILPPLDVAIKQSQSLYFLGAARHTELGKYYVGHFGLDLRITDLITKYQADLARIEKIIQSRNTQRPEYIHLLPSRIPQSINI